MAEIASVFYFLDQLFDLRIMMAPDLITPLAKANVTLEMRLSMSVGRPGELVNARYASMCAICGGEIMLLDGGKDSPDRIVGCYGALCAVADRAWLFRPFGSRSLSQTQFSGLPTC
ncbi:MAG: hypothetical protein ABI212_14695 [Burkholderiaceae bacterium]